MHWPAATESLAQMSILPAEMTSKVLSIDCLTQSFSSAENPGFFARNPVYIKLIIATVWPVLFILTSRLFWEVNRRCGKTTAEQVSRRNIATSLIFLFMAHPTLSRIYFSGFNCTEIEGANLLFLDMSQTCYEDMHLRIAVPFGLLGLVCWTFGVPFAALRVLRSHQTATIENKETTGFLTNGYRKGAHHWEVVVMLRKVVIIMI